MVSTPHGDFKGFKGNPDGVWGANPSMVKQGVAGGLHDDGYISSDDDELADRNLPDDDVMSCVSEMSNL